MSDHLFHPDAPEAQAILQAARDREERREAVRQPIDYARMSREFPKQKARLTRAKGDRDKLLIVCRDVVKEWDEIGCWPDDWNLWQIALDDAFPVFHGPRLEDLR